MARKKRRRSELQIGEGVSHRPKQKHPHIAQELREANADPDTMRQFTFRLRPHAKLCAQGYVA